MKNIILTFLISSAGIIANSQTSLELKYSPFQSLLIVDNDLMALNDNGVLFIWDLETLQKNFTSNNTLIHYTSIAKDRDNQIYLGTGNGRIFKFSLIDYTTELYLKLKKAYRVSNIFFNSNNEIFLIVPYAVYDPIRNKSWTDFEHSRSGMVVQKRRLFGFKKVVTKYFDMPQYSFIDSKDRIWMTKSFGEFGGSLQIFDTRNHVIANPNFDSLDLGLLFPKSVFEDDEGNIYITSVLQHFGNTGEIYKIDTSLVSLIYDGNDFKDTTATNSFRGGIFVGPGTYNNDDHKILFCHYRWIL